MGISAREAAAQVGLTKQAIIKAIKTGKLSAEKDRRGQWVIEPVELFRVYAPVDSGIQQPAATSSPQDTPEDSQSLQVEVRELRARLADKDGVIEDLRQRLDTASRQLDTEAEERRRLLTDSQSRRRSWWARLWGGST